MKALQVGSELWSKSSGVRESLSNVTKVHFGVCGSVRCDVCRKQTVR